MLSGQNIICFAPNRWDDIWRNRHQIMTRLRRRNRVLFVEPNVYLRQVTPAVRRQGPGVLHRAQITAPLDNLWVYRPPTYAPISGRPPLSGITFALRRRSLQNTLQSLGMTTPILWVFQYNLGEMIGHLDERLTIYHAVDEYSAYKPGQVGIEGYDWQAEVRRLETEIIGKSDLVFVTSPALYQSKHDLHSHVYLTPNGVDYEHFAVPRPREALSPELWSVPRPLLGYSGVINEKLDLALLNRMAEAHPHWSFLFVGPVALRHDQDLFQTLENRPNTYFVGRKSVEQLPAYMQACDVCLIPYVLNEWTRNISPLKLYEYMATGAPIVSTDIPAAREFADIVWIDADAGGFTQAVERALASDNPERRQRQQALARQHTWDQRIELMSDLITQRLADVAPRS